MADMIERYRWLFVGLLALPLAGALVYLLSERFDDPPPLQITQSNVPLGEIRVYVAGAVVHPGVYPIGEDKRWIDAIQAAGGPAPDANLESVNLARRIHDEDQIIVPRVGGTAAAAAAQGPLVDINTAGQEQLIELPGIGEVRAQKIIDSRTKDGRFGSIDDLLSRELIPQSVFDDISPLITAGQ